MTKHIFSGMTGGRPIPENKSPLFLHCRRTCLDHLLADYIAGALPGSFEEHKQLRSRIKTATSLTELQSSYRTVLATAPSPAFTPEKITQRCEEIFVPSLLPKFLPADTPIDIVPIRIACISL